MKGSKIIIASALCALSATSQAGDWLFALGYSSGGDNVGSVELVDGDGDTSSESVGFGDGLNYGIGGVFSPMDNLELQTSFGIKEDAVRADNGTVKFSRNMFDFLAFYAGEHFRIGGGLVKEMSAKSSGFDYDAHCGDAQGTAIEIGYRWSSFALGLRHTNIDYDCSYYAGPFVVSGTADGGNTGLQATFRF